MTTTETLTRVRIANDALWDVVVAHRKPGADDSWNCPCPACRAWYVVTKAMPDYAEAVAREEHARRAAADAGGPL